MSTDVSVRAAVCRLAGDRREPQGYKEMDTQENSTRMTKGFRCSQPLLYLYSSVDIRVHLRYLRSLRPSSVVALELAQQRIATVHRLVEGLSGGLAAGEGGFQFFLGGGANLRQISQSQPS